MVRERAAVDMQRAAVACDLGGVGAASTEGSRDILGEQLPRLGRRLQLDLILDRGGSALKVAVDEKLQHLDRPLQCEIHGDCQRLRQLAHVWRDAERLDQRRVFASGHGGHLSLQFVD